MLVYRIEHPNNAVGPFQNDNPEAGHGNPIFMSKRDERRFLEIVKGPNKEKYETCSPSPRHEIDASIQSGDRTVERRFKNFCRLGVTILSGRKTDAIYGCASKDALDAWFSMDDELRALLTKYGFEEAVYSVPDDRVLEFPKQCSWRRCDGELVQRRPL